MPTAVHCGVRINTRHLVADDLAGDLVPDGAGAVFQQFVAELIAFEYQDVHVFPSAGKDGAIDLVANQPVRTFIECKHTAGDSLISIWKAVASKLQRCLQPGRPAKKQGQYLPWYVNGRRRLRRYIFCVSTTIVNEANRIDLETSIAKVFGDLSLRPGLEHLADVEILVLDWADLEARVHKHPAILYRWFPCARPQGLLPLHGYSSTTFRAFLNDRLLPYYSRSDYAKNMGPAQAALPTESAMLDRLERGDDLAGLIITGKGGAGKTRLVLELGALAERSGWLCVRATERATRDSVVALLAVATQPMRILVLFDYVEIAPSFTDIAEYIGDINPHQSHRVRFVANCRTNYYRNIEGLPRHDRIELTPDNDEISVQYRRAVVRAVLMHAGLDPQKYSDMCRDVPVLAVFLLYLSRSGKRHDLAELLAQRDFGGWVARRVRLTFARPVDRSLAAFVLLLPLLERNIATVTPAYRELFDYLVADGWVERIVGRSGRARWEAIHDVFADRVALSYIDAIRAAAGPFVEDVIALAEQAGTIGSAIVALQRLAEFLPSINWYELFANRLRTNPAVWTSVRDDVVRSNLLTPAERLKLLDLGPQAWSSRLDSATLQYFVTGLCKDAYRDPAQYEAVLPILKNWTVRASENATQSNHIFRHGLRVFGSAVAEPALRWIKRSAVALDTDYVMVAWLERVGRCAEISEHVDAWLRQYGLTRGAGFLYRSWLEAGGDVDMVAARFPAWFRLHGATDGVDLVLRAWFKRGGTFEAVRDAAFELAVARSAELETGSLLHTITAQRVLPANVIRAVILWCRTYPEHEDVLWRLTRLRKNLLEPTVADELVATIECVIQRWFVDGALDVFTATEVTVLVSNLVSIGRKTPHLADRCDAILASWLRQRQSFELAEPLVFLQRPELVFRVDTLVRRGFLSLDSDGPALKRFVQWVSHWEPEWRQKLVPRPAWFDAHRNI